MLLHRQDTEGMRMGAPAPPVTREFDPSLKVGSEDLPLDQPPCVKSVGEYEPEQIHITLGGKR